MARSWSGSGLRRAPAEIGRDAAADLGNDSLRCTRARVIVGNDNRIFALADVVGIVSSHRAAEHRLLAALFVQAEAAADNQELARRRAILANGIIADRRLQHDGEDVACRNLGAGRIEAVAQGIRENLADALGDRRDRDGGEVRIELALIAEIAVKRMEAATGERG